jgi:PHD/YefM family antitoxin component YafN of YafNO toxin-antitoxin module
MSTISTTEARTGLSTTLGRFRTEGVNAEPVVFGDHRKQEAVVLPFELYQRVQHELAQARLLADTALMDSIEALHADPSIGVAVDRGARRKG